MNYLKKVTATIAAIIITVFCISCNTRQKAKPGSESAALSSQDTGLKLMGNRFFTLSTVVRVNQIETSRDKSDGTDESSCSRSGGSPHISGNYRKELAGCKDYMGFQLAGPEGSAAKLPGFKETGCLLS